jgi:hypothetical protein
LETAMRRIAEGSRPARRAAASSRDLTDWRFRVMGASTMGAVVT